MLWWVWRAIYFGRHPFFLFRSPFFLQVRERVLSYSRGASLISRGRRRCESSEGRHASACGRSSVKSIHNSDHQHTSHHVFTFRASLCAAAQASRATAFGGRRGCAGVLPLQEVRAPARPGRPKPLDGDTVRPAPLLAPQTVAAKAGVHMW